MNSVSLALKGEGRRQPDASKSGPWLPPAPLRLFLRASLTASRLRLPELGQRSGLGVTRVASGGLWDPRLLLCPAGQSQHL